jgi:hypothetical protein
MTEAVVFFFCSFFTKYIELIIHKQLTKTELMMKIIIIGLKFDIYILLFYCCCFCCFVLIKWTGRLMEEVYTIELKNFYIYF